MRWRGYEYKDNRQRQGERHWILADARMTDKDKGKRKTPCHETEIPGPVEPADISV